MSNFHISLPCHSVTETKNFYTNIIGVSTGRSSSNWIDVNLYTNQITFCKSGEFSFNYKSYKFEKTILPSFHLGVILMSEEWNRLKNKLEDSKYLVLKDTMFLSNKKGEHRSFFVKDPNDYQLEFKCFNNEQDIFKS